MLWKEVLRFFCVNFLTFFAASSHSQTTLDLYQQDYENPLRTLAQCTGFDGNADTGEAALSYNTGPVPYYQANTADRLCISKVGSPQDLLDPMLIAGNYAIGFHGSNNSPASIESIGFVFDPNSYRFLTGYFNASLMGVPNTQAGGFPNSSYGYEPGVSINFNVRFYEIPNGTANTDITLLRPAALGGDARLTINAVLQSPFATRTLSIDNSNPIAERFTLDWHDYSFTIDLQDMNDIGSRVMMVITGLPNHRYLAVDNFDIKAALNIITLPTAVIEVTSGSTGTFSTLTGALNDLGLPLAAQSTLISSNPAAGALEIDLATGLISFTPENGFVGDVIVTFEVCDDQVNQACATQTMTFRVLPSVTNTVTAAPVPATPLWVLLLASAGLVTLLGSRIGRIGSTTR